MEIETQKDTTCELNCREHKLRNIAQSPVMPLYCRLMMEAT